MVLQGAKPAEAHKALTVFGLIFVAGEAYRRASERELLNGAIVLDNVKISRSADCTVGDEPVVEELRAALCGLLTHTYLISTHSPLARCDGVCALVLRVVGRVKDYVAHFGLVISAIVRAFLVSPAALEPPLAKSA